MAVGAECPTLIRNAECARDGIVYLGIPGDLDGNHKVDIKDILIVAKAYGTNPQSPNWDPNIDVDCDDKIDVKDILIAAKNYGKTDP